MSAQNYFDIIAFDGDDTLWDNERLYQQAMEKFDSLPWPKPNTLSASQLLEKMEMRNILYYGYGIKSFILSMIETAIEISPVDIKSEIIKQIIKIAKDMLEAEVLLFENVQGTLQLLSQDYDLMLITKGDQFEQESKIQRSKLIDFFRYVEIVGDKNKDTYQRIFRKYQIDPHRFVMVGNSIRSDILPVIQLGGTAIYVDYLNTWAHEVVSKEELEGIEIAEIAHLHQLPEYLEKCKAYRNEASGDVEHTS